MIKQSTPAIAGAIALTIGLCGGAVSQEVKTASKYGDMTTVTQDMLNRAASDGNNFLHTNGDYKQTRYLPESPDQRPERRQAASGVDFPDRGQGVDGDDADRHQRRHVRHDVVQPRLCARRA